MTDKQLDKILCNFWDATHKAPVPPPKDFELIGKIIKDNSNLLEPLVSPKVADIRKTIKNMIKYYTLKPSPDHFEVNKDQSKIEVLEELLEKLK